MGTLRNKCWRRIARSSRSDLFFEALISVDVRNSPEQTALRVTHLIGKFHFEVRTEWIRDSLVGSYPFFAKTFIYLSYSSTNRVDPRFISRLVPIYSPKH